MRNTITKGYMGERPQTCKGKKMWFLTLYKYGANLGSVLRAFANWSFLACEVAWCYKYTKKILESVCIFEKVYCVVCVCAYILCIVCMCMLLCVCVCVCGVLACVGRATYPL